MLLVVAVVGLLCLFGFVRLRRLRLDGTSWCIVLVGVVLIALVVLYGSSLGSTVSRWFSAAGAPSASVFSLSSASAPDVSTAESVLGPPSLSAAFVDRVLAAYHSPAVGLGQTLYQESHSSGIDDAYALAFFGHESLMGTTGVAVVTRSLGNLRCTAGWSSCYEGYRAYPTWQAGARDWYRLLVSVYLPRHLTTVETIVPVYAPSSENDVGAYIASVEHAVSAWRAGRLLV
jgi:hypothetical protein